jgi:mRNA-degrading endonuclease toxin of MazEF toxin-antitoxin module
MWLRLRAALVCTLLAALTGVAVQAFLLLHAATGAARAAPVAVSREVAATRAALLAQVASARGDLAGQIQAARQDLLVRTERQVAALRTDVMGEVDQIRTTADRRVGDTLGRADAALAHVEEFRGDLKPVLDHAAGIAKQVDDAAPLFLDCEYNPDCVFNRYVGASKGIERAAMNFGQMSSDVRAALPAAITTWQAIGTNVGGITANVNRLTKPRWYDRLLGYGLNGVVIYRNLNPATNLTVKGAQIVSSRP